MESESQHLYGVSADSFLRLILAWCVGDGAHHSSSGIESSDSPSDHRALYGQRLSRKMRAKRALLLCKARERSQGGRISRFRLSSPLSSQHKEDMH